MDPPNEEDIKIKFDEVCSELNLDEDANESAWSSYRSIYNDYVLEVSYKAIQCVTRRDIVPKCQMYYNICE